MLIEVEGPNGQKTMIDAASIGRLRYIDPRKSGSGTRIDYAAGVIFTPETTKSLIKRISPSVKLVELKTRINTPIWINPEAVTMIRPAIPINAPGTELDVGGQYQHVIEDYKDVVKRLTASN